mgnify:CR=1 FL=1
MSPRQIAKCATFLTLTALTALALVVIVRTILFTPAEADLYCSSVSANGAGSNGGGDVQTSADHKAITADRGLIERFQQALRFRTVTKAPKDYSVNETHRFIHFLQSSKYLSTVKREREKAEKVFIFYQVHFSSAKTPLTNTWQ